MEPKRKVPASINSLSSDLLCAIFSRLLDHRHVIHCSAVSKSWHKIISTSDLIRDLYSIPSGISMKSYFTELAMEEHRSGFLTGSADVHQWNCHPVRFNLCRMKRGQILTGGEDKVLRLWSAESYKCLDEYAIPNINPLVDYDFDETKIVGLAGSRICILRRNRRSVFQSREGIFTRGLCMRYIDPEAVVGCEDGRARVFDMYSGSCSRIIRMHGAPVTCLTLTEEHMIFGGSTFGTVAIADLSTGEQVGILKSSFSPTGMKSLCFNMNSHLLFAGSTSGYAHCWDLRTLRPLWETRVSPNAIYSTHHLPSDLSTLAVGGLDGVLRLLNQNTGEILSSFIMDAAPRASSVIEKKKARVVSQDMCIERIPRCMRPPITCLAVGMKKIVTTHNEKYISMWRFHE